MKKHVKLFLFAVAQGLTFVTFAQQTPQSNVYGFNRYSLNPAYAGESGCTEVFFSHLNQWVRLEGAPTTSLLSVNSRIRKQLGIGGNVLVDQLGMLQQIAASGSVSYGFNFLNEHTIRFGLTAGYYQFRMNPDNAIAFDNLDNIINGGSQSASSLNSELGLLYQFKGLEASFASKQVIQTYSNFGYENLEGYGLRRHLVGLLSYRIQLNDRFALKPSVLYKGINEVSQFDINADVSYKNIVHAGLGYRTGVGLIGRVGLNVRDLFMIGYAYEVPMQNIAKFSAGSHEVIIGLKLCRKKNRGVDSLLVNQEAYIPDTIVKVEYKVDTVIVERIDTVVIENNPLARKNDDEANRVLNLASKSLEFANDKAIILKSSYGDLEALVNMMLVREDLRIRLEGHTDNNGTDEYNMNLSKNRVNAVKEFLVANGVEASRIETTYFGESKPIADNSSENGKAKNRRVELHYIR
jgi:type IX secretion system PorP/SprF family membrane protein